MVRMKTLRAKRFGDLRAQRGAFLAVWFTVFLGLTFYGSTYPAGIAMIASINQAYATQHFADFTARFDPHPAEAVVAAVSTIDGLDRVQGRLSVDAGLALTPTNRITVHLLSLPDDAPAAVNDALVVAGQPLRADGDLLLLKSFTDYHRIAPGTVLQVGINGEDRPLRVTGTVFTPEYLVAGQSPMLPFPQPNAFTVGYMRYSDLAAWIGHSGQVNELAVTLVPGANATAVQAALQSALAPFNPEYLYSRVQTASGGVIDANIRGNMAIAGFFSATFLVISGLVMAVLLARLIEGERRRIGTMRALGLTRRETTRHYLGYPLIISSTGAIAGSLAGYVGSYLVAAFFIGTLTNGTLPYFTNSPQWLYIVFGMVTMLVLALLAGALPALAAAQTDPGLALRPVTPRGMGAHARLSVPGLPLAAQ